MTFREKLEKERPNNIVESFLGGCIACPDSYGYTNDKGLCGGNILGKSSEELCRKCWDREIPEEKEKENKPTKKTKAMLEEELEQKKSEVNNVTNDAVKDGDGFTTCGPTMLGTENMYINARTIPASLLIVHPESVDPVAEAEFLAPKILDSGNRRQFESGAVRDIQEGKGRCDLMPLDVVAEYFTRDGQPNEIFWSIHRFQENGNTSHLSRALDSFNEEHWKNNRTMLLEVSKHFEDGAKKYGENNWQKGIPVHCYIDSAVRHYLKFLRGDNDEPHDRAFCWNIMCAIWTCKHKPELNEYAVKEEKFDVQT